MRTARTPGWRDVGAALLVGLVPCTVGLGAMPLLEPDEGRYAAISRDLLASGDWVVPRLDGATFHDKPPLVCWLTAASFSLLGETRTAARIAPAACGALGLGVAAWLSWRLSGRSGAAALAALLLATSPLWLGLSRTLSLDVPLATLVVLGWALHARSAGALGGEPWPALRWPAAVALGLATLAKGPVALVVAGGAAIAVALVERDRALAWRLLNPAPWLLAALIAAPWSIAFAWRAPAGARAFLLEQNVARFVAWSEHQGGPHFYALALAWGMLPVTALLVASARSPTRGALASLRQAAVGLWRRAPDERGRASRCTATFALVVIAFFTAASSKVETYVLPALPPLAALAGAWVDRRLRGASGRVRARLATFALAAAPLLAPVTLVALGLAGPALRGERLRLAARGAWTGAALALVPAAVAAGALVCARRGRERAGLCMVLAALALLTLPALPVGARAATTSSAEAVGLAIRARRAEAAGVPVITFGVYLRGLPFHLGEPVILSLTTAEDRLAEIRRERPDLVLESADDVASALARRERALIVTSGAWRVDLLLRVAARAGARLEDGSLRHLGRHGGVHLFEVWPRPGAPP